MSYSTLDRYGGLSTTYAYARGGGGAAVGTGSKGMWWPDYGPTTKDFSQQRRSHPAESIFEGIMEPRHWDANREKKEVPPSPESTQFRHPVPAREAMLKAEPSLETKIAAHEVTQRQGALRRAEARQKRIDSWLDEAPIRLPGGAGPQARHIRSESSLDSGSCSRVSRETYEKFGFLVGRSRGSIADGKDGSLSLRSRNSLALTEMLFDKKQLSRSVEKLRTPKESSRKYVKPWQTMPESGFVFDPKSFLPIPRGGWDTQVPERWPDLETTGRRDLLAPVGQSTGNLLALA